MSIVNTSAKTSYHLHQSVTTNEPVTKSPSLADTLEQLIQDSYLMSHRISTESISSSDLTTKVRSHNKKITDNLTALAQKFSCSEEEIKKLIITLPKSLPRRIFEKVSLVFRVIIAVARIFPILLVFGVFCPAHKSQFSDPKTITKNLTPTLLVHGSGSNQRQWEIFRLFLKRKSVGHVFSLNLNDAALANDKKTLSEYVKVRLVPKLQEMKKQYAKAGTHLTEINLIGHSMGGLLAELLDEDEEFQQLGIKIKSLVAISTPFGGSKAADKIYTADDMPECAFRTDNEETKAIRQRVIEKAGSGKMNVYTFSSTLDPAVRPYSSSLPINPKNQLYSIMHDHHSTMFDPFLATKIAKMCLTPNSSAMPVIGYEACDWIIQLNS